MSSALHRSSPASATQAPLLIGCAHGTADRAGRAAIRSILDDVRAARPDLEVREAFVDVQEPSVAQVVADTPADRSLVVVPVLLSGGHHVHVDIARAVTSRSTGAPGVAAAPLGPDPRLVAVLLDRLRSVGITDDDAVVLAAAGSSDPRARDAVETVAAELRTALRTAVRSAGDPTGRTEPDVTVGYGAIAAPTVADAVAAARSRGAARVVVASYLLAPGHFHDRLGRVGADLVTDPLAPDPRLAEIVLDRYIAAERELGGPQA